MDYRFDRDVELSTVGQEGLVLSLAAGPEVLAELARLLDLLAITSLSGKVEIFPWRKNGFRVSGTIAAEVTQSCVVTLEPVSETIEETFERTFLPGTESRRSEHQEIDIDPEADDPPDLLSGTSLDLKALLVEQLALGVNPYPRKPGAEAELPSEGGEEDRVSPFAALGNLKKSGGGDGKSEA